MPSSGPTTDAMYASAPRKSWFGRSYWWAIPKGTPKLDAAYKFLAYASGPERQADQTNYISYGPANMDAVPNINPDVLANLPTAPDNMKTALVVDPQFWADKGEELRERFNAWLAQ